MNRIDIINSLIKKNNYKYYLEIGVRDGSCFNAINCNFKVGVDPDLSSAATVFMTSDEYFESLVDAVKNGNLTIDQVKYDIIFIDGLHHSDQVIKDIENSLKFLTENGKIVMHDCLPTSEFMQRIPMQPDHNEWTGDVWKAYVHFRMTRNDIHMAVVDTDWGCGIITPGGHQERLVPTRDVTYENFVNAKHVWMNIISVAEFQKRYL